MSDHISKILYIHHAAGWGGAPNCLINLIKSLDDSKYASEVLLLKYSVIAEKLEQAGIKYKIAESVFYRKHYHFFAHSEAGYVKWYQIYKFLRTGISWVLSRYVFAKRELDKLDYDIVHLNSSVLTDWLAPASKRGRVIIHIREPFRKGSIDILHAFFKNVILKYSDKIIAISKDNAIRIGIPDKTEVIYDFCDIPERLPLIDSYNSRKALYLGGTSTSKGFYTLIKALDYLDKDVKVYFAGKHVKSTKPENVIQYLKYIFSNSRKRDKAIKVMLTHPNAKHIDLIYNVQDYLDEVCCLVSPFSVPHFSFPVVEAHMRRKPVVGSDVVGMDEIILNGRNGLIVPVNNPKALAEAINSLTSDGLKAKELGDEGYKTAIQKFTSENIKNVELIYDGLLNHQSQRQ